MPIVKKQFRVRGHVRAGGSWGNDKCSNQCGNNFPCWYECDQKMQKCVNDRCARKAGTPYYKQCAASANC